MENELISVIVPVYNVERYIRQTLDSIVNQTYENLEILVINDGSTDNSGAICDEYRTDNRVKVFHRENAGLSATRQFGIDQCSGNYFVTVDSDDYVSPYYIEKLYHVIKANEADVAVCSVSCFADGTDKITQTYIPHCLTGKLIVTKEILITDYYRIARDLMLTDSWNKMYRTQFVGETGVKFQLPKIYNGNDLKFNHLLALHCPVYCVCEEALLFHRNRSGSIVSRKNKPLQEGFETITESLIEECKTLGLSLKKQISNVYYWMIGNVVMDIIYRGGNTYEKHARYEALIERNNQFLKKHRDDLEKHTGLARFKLGDSSIHLPAFVLGCVLWLDIASLGILFLRAVKYKLRK